MRASERARPAGTPRPGVRFSLGHASSRKVGRRAETTTTTCSAPTASTTARSSCSVSVVGRDEEGLPADPTLKLDHGRQLRHPLRCIQPRPAACQLLGLDRAELDIIDLQHRAKSIQNRALAGSGATDQDQSLAHRRILTTDSRFPVGNVAGSRPPRPRLTAHPGASRSSRPRDRRSRSGRTAAGRRSPSAAGRAPASRRSAGACSRWPWRIRTSAVIALRPAESMKSIPERSSRTWLSAMSSASTARSRVEELLSASSPSTRTRTQPSSIGSRCSANGVAESSSPIWGGSSRIRPIGTGGQIDLDVRVPVAPESGRNHLMCGGACGTGGVRMLQTNQEIATYNLGTSATARGARRGRQTRVLLSDPCAASRFQPSPLPSRWGCWRCSRSASPTRGRARRSTPRSHAATIRWRRAPTRSCRSSARRGTRASPTSAARSWC